MSPRNHDGFILISVLSIVALLAALVGSVSMLVRSTLDGARNASDDLALRALVKAGTELAGYELYGLKLPLERMDGQQLRLDAGTVTLFATDESGKVDLNGASPALLAAAYSAAGLSAPSPAAFAARVVDWRDHDNTRSAEGAEAAEYKAASLDYGPQNDEFRSVGELQWVLGLTAAHVAALAPLVTVYNPDGKLNIMSASRQALLALPGVDSPTAERIVAMRQNRTEAGLAALQALLQAQQDFIKMEPGPSYRVRLEARAGNGRTRSSEAVLVPSPRNNALYYVAGGAD